LLNIAFYCFGHATVVEILYFSIEMVAVAAECKKQWKALPD